MLLTELKGINGTTPSKLPTAYEVVKFILGANRCTDDSETLKDKDGKYFVCQPWSGNGPMFSDMDCAPGEGGCVALVNIHGKSPLDLAHAVHEGTHAWLHMNGKDSHNENLTNHYGAQFARKLFSGQLLNFILEYLLTSNRSYGHKQGFDLT
jgi:hypothetical protein